MMRRRRDELESKVLYHLAELLVQPVTRPTTSFFVWDLGGDPIAQMLLVLFIELRAPMNV